VYDVRCQVGCLAEMSDLRSDRLFEMSDLKSDVFVKCPIWIKGETKTKNRKIFVSPRLVFASLLSIEKVMDIPGGFFLWKAAERERTRYVCVCVCVCAHARVRACVYVCRRDVGLLCGDIGRFCGDTGTSTTAPKMTCLNNTHKWEAAKGGGGGVVDRE